MCCEDLTLPKARSHTSLWLLSFWSGRVVTLTLKTSLETTWRIEEAQDMLCGGFPGGSVEKNLPAMQETSVQTLGWDDPLEKEMATHSSILAWRIPWTEEPGRQQSTGSQRVRRDLGTKTTTTTQDMFCKEGVRESESFLSLWKRRDLGRTSTGSLNPKKEVDLLCCFQSLIEELRCKVEAAEDNWAWRVGLWGMTSERSS